MLRTRRFAPLLPLLGLLALQVAGAPSSVGGPTVYTYPGDAPCDTTLQTCISGVPAGSVIELAYDGPRVEGGLSITKGLTLRPAAGFDPIVRPYASDEAEYISVSDGTASQIVLRNLVLRNYHIDVDLHDAGAAFSLIRSDVRHHKPHNNYPALGVQVHDGADAEVTIVDNLLASNSFGIDASFESATTALIQGNEISGGDPEHDWTGLSLFLTGTQPIHVDVLSNLIHHKRAAEGLAVYSNADSSSVNVVNNTIDRIPDGPAIEMEVSQDGNLSATLFNNTASRSRRGINLDLETGAFNLNYGSNNTFGNANPDDYSPFSSSVVSMHADPEFVDPAAGNYRLRAGSPLLDQGRTCNAGGLSQSDAGGMFRFEAPAVDIGAYERGAPDAGHGQYIHGTELGDILDGTPGKDILCGFGEGDSMEASTGGDAVFGGDGGDAVDGQGGPDFVVGGEGEDAIMGKGGNDVVRGRDGAPGDSVDGGAGNDVCTFDPGDGVTSC